MQIYKVVKMRYSQDGTLKSEMQSLLKYGLKCLIKIQDRNKNSECRYQLCQSTRWSKKNFFVTKKTDTHTFGNEY